MSKGEKEAPGSMEAAWFAQVSSQDVFRVCLCCGSVITTLPPKKAVIGAPRYFPLSTLTASWLWNYWTSPPRPDFSGGKGGSPRGRGPRRSCHSPRGWGPETSASPGRACLAKGGSLGTPQGHPGGQKAEGRQSLISSTWAWAPGPRPLPNQLQTPSQSRPDPSSYR